MFDGYYATGYGYDVLARQGARSYFGGGKSRQARLTSIVRDSLFDAAQNAVRNDIEAKAAIRRVTGLVVGPRGPLVTSDTGSDPLDRLLDELYGEWAEGATLGGGGDFRCDVMGLRSLRAMMGGVVEEWMTSGACGVMLIDTPEDDGSLQEIEGRRFRNPNGRLDSDTMIAGVELTRPGGRVRQYHVARYQMGGMTLSSQTDTVEAGDMMYLPQPLDTPMGVIAPEPILGVGLVTIGQIAEFLLATTESGKVQAMTPIAIKRGEDPGDLSGDSEAETDAPGVAPDDEGRLRYNLVRNYMGNFLDLNNGDDIVNLRQEMPSAAIKPLIDIQMQRLAMLLNMSVEALTGNWSGANFSVAKLSLQTTEVVRDWLYEPLISGFLRPARAHMIDAALRLGLIDVPASDSVDLYRFSHRAPMLPDPDPNKTAVTRAMQLSHGMLTMGDYWADKGLDPNDELAKLADERAAFKRAGVPHPTERDDAGEGAQLDDEAESNADGVGGEAGEPDPNRRGGEPREAGRGGGGGPGENTREAVS